MFDLALGGGRASPNSRPIFPGCRQQLFAMKNGLRQATTRVHKRSILPAHALAEGGVMSRKIKAAGRAACAIVLGSAVLLAQAPTDQKVAGAGASLPADAGTSSAHGCGECELPITLRQNIEAGKTAVGTKVEGRLVIGTMIEGGVLPRGAVIFGEVIESVAKSENSPSRLAIRMTRSSAEPPNKRSRRSRTASRAAACLDTLGEYWYA